MSATAQEAHDALLAVIPAGAVHECAMCTTGAGTDRTAKEVAEVVDGERTFSQTEHFALLTDAVARETASLQSDKDELTAQVEALGAEKAEVEGTLRGQLDVLEAEKVAAEKARGEAVEELEQFQAGLQELAEIETRKSERSAAVKEAAGELLDDEYFTEDRVTRWASLTEEAFEQVLTDFRDLAAKAPKGKPAPAADDDEDDMPEKARESAAFAGGDSPSAAGAGSLFNQFLTATGRIPAASA